jgi:hypothetical protein
MDRRFLTGMSLLLLILIFPIGLSIEYLKQSQKPIGHRYGFRLGDEKLHRIHPPRGTAYLETGSYYSNNFGLIGPDVKPNELCIVIYGSSTSMRYGEDLRNILTQKGYTIPVLMAARTGLSIRGILLQMEQLHQLGFSHSISLVMPGGGLMLDWQIGRDLIYHYSDYQIQHRAFSYWQGNFIDWSVDYSKQRLNQLWYSWHTDVFKAYQVDPLNLNFTNNIKYTLTRFQQDLEKCVILSKLSNNKLLLVTNSSPQASEFKLFQNITYALNPIIRKVATEHQVDLIDMEDKFISLSDEHFQDGFHWSKLGNQQAAKWIFDYLLESRSFEQRSTHP